MTLANLVNHAVLQKYSPIYVQIYNVYSLEFDSLQLFTYIC